MSRNTDVFALDYLFKHVCRADSPEDRNSVPPSIAKSRHYWPLYKGHEVPGWLSRLGTQCWLWLRSWSQGCEIQPCGVRLLTRHGVCLRFSLCPSLCTIPSPSLKQQQRYKRLSLIHMPSFHCIIYNATIFMKYFIQNNAIFKCPSWKISLRLLVTS